MLFVGIDVAKYEHDCCILEPDGEILFSPFSIPNTHCRFDDLYKSSFP